MSGLDALPPDQRAVLQLVLRQGRTYEDIAGLLGIDANAVRTRAHAACDAVAPDTGGRLPEGRRGDIVDFLLGQQTVSEREITRTYLAGSAPARAWAEGVSGELAALGGEALPAIPGGEADLGPEPGPFEPEPPADRLDEEPALVERPLRHERGPGLLDRGPGLHEAPAAERLGRGRPGAPRAPRGPRESSRLGGALLLAGLGIIVAVVVIVLASGGDDGEDTEPARTGTQAQTTAGGGTGGATGGGTGTAAPEAQVNLRSADGSNAIGVAQIVNQGGERAMALVGQKLAASPRGYAVWLFNSTERSVRLGFTQPVTRNGRLSALARLPRNASQYRELVVSRETSRDPKQPTRIVLRGSLRLER